MGLYQIGTNETQFDPHPCLLWKPYRSTRRQATEVDSQGISHERTVCSWKHLEHRGVLLTRLDNDNERMKTRR